MPQIKGILKETDPGSILHQAASVLGCSVESFKKTRRISEAGKDNRDLLIYFLWEAGMYTNREIGELFGLTYSSISRRVNIAKERIKKKRQLNTKYQQLKSLIKA